MDELDSRFVSGGLPKPDQSTNHPRVSRATPCIWLLEIDFHIYPPNIISHLTSALRIADQLGLPHRTFEEPRMQNSWRNIMMMITPATEDSPRFWKHHRMNGARDVLGSKPRYLSTDSCNLVLRATDIDKLPLLPLIWAVLSLNNDWFGLSFGSGRAAYSIPISRRGARCCGPLIGLRHLFLDGCVLCLFTHSSLLSSVFLGAI